MNDGRLVDLGIPGISAAVLIGTGGTARVYRARQEHLHRTVAVKILTSTDDIGRRQFEREGRALGQLSAHPGIVKVYDAGLSATGEPYLVMEYCAAGSLRDRLSAGPIPWPKAVATIATVAGTIADTHADGILHRDLKPANVLLDTMDRPLVSDFGLARLLDSTTASGPSTSVGFTPGYVPPETLTGERPSAASDVYSLGATLYSLISGQVPFMEADEQLNIVALARRIAEEPVADLRVRGIPDAVCRVIEDSMAKDPSTRPTARQMADRLHALASLGTDADPLPPVVGAQHTLRVPSHPSDPTVPPISLDPPPPAAIPVLPPLVAAPPISLEPPPLPPLPAVSPGAPPTRAVPVGGGGLAPHAPSPPPLQPPIQPPRPPGQEIAPPGSSPPASGPKRRLGPVLVAVVLLGGAGAVIAALTLGGGGDGGTVGVGEATPTAEVTEATEGGATDEATEATTEETATEGATEETATEGASEEPATDEATEEPTDEPSVTEEATAPTPDLTVAGSVPVGTNASLVVAAGGLAWTSSSADGEVIAIDPGRLVEAGRVSVGPSPVRPVAVGDRIVVATTDGQATVIDGATREVIGTVAIGAAPDAGIGAFDRAWVPNQDSSSVTVVDPMGMSVVDIAVGSGPADLGMAFGLVWVPNRRDHTVSAIDPDSLEVVATIPTGEGPKGPVEGGEYVFVVNQFSDSVTVISPQTFEVVAEIPVGDNPFEPVVYGDRVYVVGNGDESLSAIDMATLEVVATASVGPDPTGALAALDRIWVANRAVTEGDAGAIRVLDPVTLEELDQIEDLEAGLRIPSEINGQIWIPSFEAGLVLVVDQGG